MQATNNEGEAHFHWADYVVFIAMLALSAFLGVFYGWRDRTKKTAENFLIANRSMSPIPVGISLFVSFLSATSILADPVEVYRYGLVYWYLCIGYCLSLPIIAHFMGPRYHRMKLISANKFIASRYNKILRVFVAIISTLTTLVFVAIVLLAPSLALSQVTPLEVWMSVLIVGLVCTFYTTLGGMKAVLWADTLQSVIMIAGLFAVLIRAAIDVGGIKKVWEIAEEGGRINLDKIDPNPLQHATVWTYLAGGFFRTFNTFSSNQPMVQRYSSLPTERSVTISVYIAMALFFIFGSLLALTGLVMYAYYHDCDPLLAGRISQSDQMLPLLTMDVLGFLPGIPGLFIACIFSACMSTLSSFISGLSAFCLKDFVMPLYKLKTGSILPGHAGNLVSKILSFVLGLITIGLVFSLLQAQDAGLFQMTNLIAGSFGSPLSGLFITGFLFPIIGDVAITCGLIVSLGVSFWLGIGAFLHPNTVGRLPGITSGCDFLNMTTSPASSSLRMQHTGMSVYGLLSDEFDENNSTGFHITDLYKLSSLLYFSIGPTLNTVVGLIVTGFIYAFDKVRGSRSEKYSVDSLDNIASKQDDFELSKYSFAAYDNPFIIDQPQLETFT